MPQRSPLDMSPDEIDLTADLPAAQQIANRIRHRIETHELRTGDLLPGRRALAGRLGCSRDNVAAAYRILTDDGYMVTRRHGQSGRVRARPPVRRMNTSRYAEALARAKAGVRAPDLTSICVDYGASWGEYTVDTEYGYMPATDAHARLLAVRRNSLVLRRELVESVRDVPVQIRRSILAASVVRGTPVADPGCQPWPDGTVNELWSLGYAASAVRERAQSRPATSWEAEKLLLPVDHHVWVITRRFMVPDQGEEPVPVEVSDLVMPAAGNMLEWETQIQV